MPRYDGALPISSSGGLSFTQGFLLGQISIVILIGAFIKFFVFGEIPISASRGRHRRKSDASTSTTLYDQGIGTRRRATSSLESAGTGSSPQKLREKRSNSHIVHAPARLTTATILSKTYYNVNSHQPESLDWFNVLIAQTIAQFRHDAQDDDAILTSLTEILNGAQKPDFISDIVVTDVCLGEEFPILSNCRVHPVENGRAQGEGELGASISPGPRLQAHMDVDLSDFITLGIETKLILNYPRPCTAVLPIALKVSVVRFSGTLSISFLPSSARSADPTATAEPGMTGQSLPPSTTPTSLAFSFLPDYRLDLSVQSLIGSRSRLQDIPKIAQLVESRLHQWIDERCVLPRMQQVMLPSFWPRKKNTRRPNSGSANEVVDSDAADEATRAAEVKPQSGGFAMGPPDIDRSRQQSRDDHGDESRLAQHGRVGSSANKAAQQQSQSDHSSVEEGLRFRRRDYQMPGSLPGMTIN